MNRSYRAALWAALLVLGAVLAACDAGDVATGDVATTGDASVALSQDLPILDSDLICVFQVVGTSNAVGVSDNPDDTETLPAGQAVTYTPGAAEEIASLTEDPTFGNTGHGSMWPAFAEAFWEETDSEDEACALFLGSSARYGGRVTKAGIDNPSPTPDIPECGTISGAGNNWHPDCASNQFDEAVDATAATLAAANDAYGNNVDADSDGLDDNIYFGGWVWNAGNDQLPAYDDVVDDYEGSLLDFYDAFDAEPAFADYEGQKVFYIQSTIKFDRFNWWDYWIDGSEWSACDDAASCIVAAVESEAVYNAWSGAPQGEKAWYYRYDGTKVHWEHEALDHVGGTAGESVGAYMVANRIP